MARIIDTIHEKQVLSKCHSWLDYMTSIRWAAPVFLNV